MKNQHEKTYDFDKYLKPLLRSFDLIDFITSLYEGWSHSATVAETVKL